MAGLRYFLALLLACICVDWSRAAPPIAVPSDASAVAVSQVQTSQLIVASATANTATAQQLGTARAVTLAISSDVLSASGLLTDTRAQGTYTDTVASVVAPTTLTSVPSNPSASAAGSTSAGFRSSEPGAVILALIALAGSGLLAGCI